MKQIIRLTEADIQNMVAEAIFQHNPMNPLNRIFRRPGQQVNGSDTMAGVYADDFDDSVLANAKGVSGDKYRKAQQEGVSYMQVMANVASEISGYLHKGWFGRDQRVLQVVKSFIEHLTMVVGSYKAQVAKMTNNVQWPQAQLAEAQIGRWEFNRIDNGLEINRYPYQNSVGVRQGTAGDWMTQLANELQTLLSWKFISGTQTVAILQKMIEYLTVDKQNILNIPLWNRNRNGNNNQNSPEQVPNNGGNAPGGGNGGNSPINTRGKMIAIIGLAMLLGLGGLFKGCDGNGNTTASTGNNNANVGIEQQAPSNANQGSWIEYQQAGPEVEQDAGWDENQQTGLDQERGIDGSVINTGANGQKTAYKIQHNGNKADTLAAWPIGSAENLMNEAINRIVKKTIRNYIR